MHSTRRSFLLGSSAVVTSVSGCLDVLRSETEMVGLTLANYTAELQPLKLDILPEDGEGNAVEGREFQIPPPEEGESAGDLREPEIVERGRYLVQVLLKNGRGQRHHHHFRPDVSDSIFVRIYRDEETESLYVRFR